MSSSTTSFLNISLTAAILSLCLVSPVSAQQVASSFTTALASHGGAAVDAVQTIRIHGQSTDRNGVETPVTISADLTGKIRLDYGDPITRSVVHVPQGEFEVNGDAVQYKQPYVGIFAGFDLLSILGLRRLELGGVQWTDAGTTVQPDRTILQRSVDTGDAQLAYGRQVKDAFEVDFDAQTGLVAAVTRQQYAAKSMDVVFPVTYSFSDHRSVGNVILPFRIDKLVSARLAETIKISSIEINPALSASIFER